MKGDITEYNFEDLYGTYRGLAPTNNEKSPIGELEIIITEESMKIRHATGLGIDETELPISYLERMSKSEIDPNNQIETSMMDRIVGYKTEGGVQYLFIPTATDSEFGLLVKGNELSDKLPPIMLYNPLQVERGAYQNMLNLIKQNLDGNYIATLEANGKVPNN